MLHSKKIYIIITILILSCIGYYVFNIMNIDAKNNIPQNDFVQNTTVKKEQIKDEILNPAHKYYKDNLEQLELRKYI